MNFSYRFQNKTKTQLIIKKNENIIYCIFYFYFKNETPSPKCIDLSISELNFELLQFIYI